MQAKTGCERIYSEKASGRSTNGRPEFGKLMKTIALGDTVVVTKLDRLARSSDAEEQKHLKEELARMTFSE